MNLISDGGINTNTLDTVESIMLTKNKTDIDGVKLDVRKSFDKIFVICRYEELNRLTYANGLISEHNYSYLRKVKFPSHIFKYYIPTLEEILKNYNKDKIMVLEIYFIDDLDKLFILLVKYSYKYYFLSKDDKILSKLKELDYDKLGTIISNKDIINGITNNDLYANTFLIK